MLKKFLKKVSVIIMGLSIFSLIGCSGIDKDQAADVVRLLQEKYNQEFEATHIGGRYGTGNDTVTTYVHPANDESLVFKAVMGKDGDLVSDSYIPRLISNHLNQILQQELTSVGIESETFTFVMKADSSSETNSDISLEDYVSKYKPNYFSGHMIVKETPDLKPEDFEAALKAVYKAGLDTIYQVRIRVIAEDEYEKCLAKFKELPEVTSTWFIDYTVVEEIDAVVDPNGYNFQVNTSTSTGDGE